MRVGDYLHSDQFQWSLWQGILSYIAVIIASVASYVVGEVDGRAVLSAALIALLPILNRIREGVSDAQRNDENKVLDRDVTATS